MFRGTKVRIGNELRYLSSSNQLTVRERVELVSEIEDVWIEGAKVNQLIRHESQFQPFPTKLTVLLSVELVWVKLRVELV